MDYKLLSEINCPDDLKKTDKAQIPSLCDEIRAYLIENVSKTGGHLASNLGIVELTVAIHRIFNSPDDKIIFDVGHQSYVHKILTGRKDAFSELRKTGGLSGFTTRKEGEYDPFGAGHSSTSISAALGFAEAAILKKEKYRTVCVIGDGAYTGGMVHEALNNCRKDLPLTIVLNENRMSISKNKGAFARYLAKVRVSVGYTNWKRGTNSVFKKIPLIGKPILATLTFIKSKLKRLMYSANYFEDLGLHYIGPINGNDYKTVERALKEAKRCGGCALVHVYTKKGKGYEPAEHYPDEFHSVVAKRSEGESFGCAFSDELVKIAQKDKSVVAVTAAMGIGTGLQGFEKAYPDRYFDVGIAEAHALTFSAGLAAAGLKPYVAIYSTFLQRGYDNIIHDIALQNLPVKIFIDRAGLAVADGPTHHGIFDIAFLNQIPNMSIISPATLGSLKEAVNIAHASESPIAVRYPNKSESDEVVSAFYKDGNFATLGVIADTEELCEVVLAAVGVAVEYALGAKRILSERGITAKVLLIEKLKPAEPSVEKIAKAAQGAERLVFIEEGIGCGGFSMTAKSYLADLKNKTFDVSILAIDDDFAAPDEKCDLYDFVGISPEKIAETVLKLKSEI